MEIPLDLDTILSEFSEEDTAWILKDLESGKYVTIPHERYPGRQIVHFFMSSEDATKLGRKINAVHQELSSREVFPYEVKLKASLRSLATHPQNGFVVPTPNEVFEFLNQKESHKNPVVHSEPEILGGTPVFLGTRVPLRYLMDHLEGGYSLDEFLDQFPSVSRHQAVAALEMAHEVLTVRARAAR
jgi:uncharacterized protein (DUF433 family)